MKLICVTFDVSEDDGPEHTTYSTGWSCNSEHVPKFKARFDHMVSDCGDLEIECINEDGLDHHTDRAELREALLVLRNLYELTHLGAGARPRDMEKKAMEEAERVLSRHK